MEKVKPISKEDFESLYSEDITKKRHKEIIANIEERVDYIVRTIDPKLGWWDYDNESGSEYGPFGYFDPDSYKEFISITGEFSNEWLRQTSYGIPTKWIWEDDFEQEYKKEINHIRINKQKKKEEAKRKRDELANKRKDMIISISKKLNTEELKFFKRNIKD